MSSPWHLSREVMPIRDSVYGFLVIPENGCKPIIAHFDETSKRFSAYIQTISKYIQIPSVAWMEIPIFREYNDCN